MLFGFLGQSTNDWTSIHLICNLRNTKQMQTTCRSAMWSVFVSSHALNANDLPFNTKATTFCHHLPFFSHTAVQVFAHNAIPH